MNDMWPRLERQIALHAPELSASLRPPATEQQLEDAQSAFGIDLPEEVWAAYRRHDGCERTQDGSVLHSLFGHRRWVPLDEALSLWRRNVAWHEEDGDDETLYPPDSFSCCGTVRSAGPLPQWFPIAHDGRNDLYIDMAPGPNGRRGQFIGFSLEGGVGYVAESLNEYLVQLLLGLEEGHIYFDSRELCWFDRRTGNGFNTVSSERLRFAELWARLDRQLMQKAPELAASLRPPASEQQLKEAQAAFGLELPVDVWSAYRQHDGCERTDHFPALNRLFGTCRWMPLDEALSLWRRCVANHEQAGATPPQWFPIAEGGDQGTIFIDMAPRSDGQHGQVVSYAPEAGLGYVAASLSEYLIQLRLGLESAYLYFDRREACWMDRRTGSRFKTISSTRLGDR